jgi:hypothetical protein
MNTCIDTMIAQCPVASHPPWQLATRSCSGAPAPCLMCVILQSTISVPFLVIPNRLHIDQTAPLGQCVSSEGIDVMRPKIAPQGLGPSSVPHGVQSDCLLALQFVAATLAGCAYYTWLVVLIYFTTLRRRKSRENSATALRTACPSNEAPSVTRRASPAAGARAY